jgi:hypothetical protein
MIRAPQYLTNSSLERIHLFLEDSLLRFSFCAFSGELQSVKRLKLTSSECAMGVGESSGGPVVKILAGWYARTGEVVRKWKTASVKVLLIFICDENKLSGARVFGEIYVILVALRAIRGSFRAGDEFLDAKCARPEWRGAKFRSGFGKSGTHCYCRCN